MRVSELYGKPPLAGADVCIVGSGASLDVFPREMIADRVCILLNDTWRHLPGIGPVAFANNRKFLDGCELPYQVVKGRYRFERGAERTDNHVSWDHPRYHVFSYREPVIKGSSGEGWKKIKTGDQWSHHDERALWAEPDFYWCPKHSCSAVFAAQFAMLAGVRSITFVGCDCCEVGRQTYVSTKQPRDHVRRDFGAYTEGMLRMVREGRERGIPVVSLQPFMGLTGIDQQYKEMAAWK